jgi:adenylate cyclase
VAEGFQLVFHLAGKRVVRSFEQARIVVGRSMVCDVVFESPHLSRKHAELVREGEEWIVRDLQSRHGLAVNGEVVESRKLASGDRITLAPAAADPTVLEFRLTNAVEQAPPQVSFGDDPATTRIIASIDLREMAQTLRKSGRLMPFEIGKQSGEAPSTHQPEPTIFETSPRLTALALLKSAGEVLMSHETLDDMLQPMVDLIGEHLPGHRVAICLSDPSSGELMPRCYSRETRDGSRQGDSPNFAGDPEGESTKGEARNGTVSRPVTFAISRSILHEAARVRRALLVASASDDPRFVSAVSIRQIGIHSAICVPLYHEDRVEGAVYVDSRRQAAILSGNELEVLSVLGLMLAAGIAQIGLRADVARERAIRGRLSRYYSPQVVEQIMRMTPRRADEMLADEYDVTVLFADLGGFTALAESLSAAEAVRVLNLIFERWAADVFARDGTLDKYIGDAVMAVFGAPLRQADHARRAVATALAMQQSLVDFNRQRPQEQSLTVRIGVNSGRVIAGDIGSPLHRGYTVIGDAVNIASRLESSLAKPGEVLIGQATFEQIEGHYRCEPLGPVQLRGKRQAIHVFRVLGDC